MKALYYQEGGHITLDVIGKVKDGKADLGRGKDVLVAGVLVAEDAKPGTCTILEDEDPKAALKANAKSLRLRATELSKAVTEASKAADAAKGKPEHTELLANLAATQEAAKAADTAADEAEKALK